MQRPRTQTPVKAPDLVVPIVEDDTEEAPWMVMGDAQFWIESSRLMGTFP
jgi:hypothetical protein